LEYLHMAVKRLFGRCLRPISSEQNAMRKTRIPRPHAWAIEVISGEVAVYTGTVPSLGYCGRINSTVRFHFAETMGSYRRAADNSPFSASTSVGPGDILGNSGPPGLVPGFKMQLLISSPATYLWENGGCH
jgi:hypothetical protein